MGEKLTINHRELHKMIKPLNDFIIIKPNEIEEKSSAGIVLLETAQQKPQTGTVVAVGRGRLAEDGTRIPLSVSNNDKVIYARYAGTEVLHEGQSLLIVREMDILAIID